jgi:hypothetical protein
LQGGVIRSADGVKTSITSAWAIFELTAVILILQFSPVIA